MHIAFGVEILSHVLVLLRSIQQQLQKLLVYFLEADNIGSRVSYHLNNRTVPVIHVGLLEPHVVGQKGEVFRLCIYFAGEGLGGVRLVGHQRETRDFVVLREVVGRIEVVLVGVDRCQGDLLGEESWLSVVLVLRFHSPLYETILTSPHVIAKQINILFVS